MLVAAAAAAAACLKTTITNYPSGLLRIEGEPNTVSSVLLFVCSLQPRPSLARRVLRNRILLTSRIMNDRDSAETNTRPTRRVELLWNLGCFPLLCDWDL